MNKALIIIILLCLIGLLSFVTIIVFGDSIKVSSRLASECLENSNDKILEYSDIVKANNLTKEDACELMRDNLIELKQCLDNVEQDNQIFALTKNLTPEIRDDNYIKIHNENCAEWGSGITE